MRFFVFGGECVIIFGGGFGMIYFSFIVCEKINTRFEILKILWKAANKSKDVSRKTVSGMQQMHAFQNPSDDFRCNDNAPPLCTPSQESIEKHQKRASLSCQ